MKHIFSRFLLIATLFIAPSCASTNKSSQSEVHQGHSMDEPKSKTNTSAQLTAPKNVTFNQPIPLIINIQDESGKAVSKFETFQEKLMHLIVVRDDLQSFAHLHPIHQGNGKFEVNATFPTAGNYTLFSDYKLSGNNETVSVMKLTIPGNVPIPQELEKFEKSQTIGDTKVNFQFNEPNIKAGKDVSLIFDLKDAANNQPIKDLQPYLGEKGHLVIVKTSSPLTPSDYIHAHAIKDSPDGRVQFMTSFPEAGTYKLWGQFNRNGKIITADFWVSVS